MYLLFITGNLLLYLLLFVRNIAFSAAVCMLVYTVFTIKDVHGSCVLFGHIIFIG